MDKNLIARGLFRLFRLRRSFAMTKATNILRDPRMYLSEIFETDMPRDGIRHIFRHNNLASTNHVFTFSPPQIPLSLFRAEVGLLGESP